MKEIIESIKLVFKSKKYLIITIFSSLLMLILAIIIPSLITPGNSIAYQFSLLNFSSWFLIVSFSILFGISMSMNMYAMSLNKKRALMVGKGTSTTFITMLGSMFSGPLCASCIATILGLFGLGSATILSFTVFLFSHRTLILILSLGIIIMSIYFTGKQINKICKNC